MALNNIKKSKSASITLAILIMFSTALLYIGSSVMLNLNSFFNNKIKDLNDANICSIVHSNYVYEKSYEIIKNNPHTKKIESEDILSFNPVTFKNKKNDVSTQLNICDAEKNRTLSKLNFTEKAKEKVKNGIVLSYNFKAGYGYNIGDKITFKCAEKKLTFMIYGFFEDTLYNNNSYTEETKAYLYHDDYERLRNSLGNDYKYKIINVKTDTIDNSNSVMNNYINELSGKLKQNQYDFVSMNSTKSRSNSNMFINILMAILIGFSSILVIIVLIIIGFSITTYVEDNIQNIGALQAIGYTNREVINVSLLQFMMLALLGSVLGLAISFIVTPYVSNMISSIVGLKWPIKVSFVCSILSAAVILSSVFIISFISAGRIKKITPVIALRSGIKMHNFKKNHVKLDGYKGNINLAISMKNIFHYSRQNCMIAVIIAALTFVCIFSTVVFYNFIISNKFMVNMLGNEKIDVLIDASSNTSQKIYDEMKQDSRVRKVIKMWDRAVSLKDEITRLYVYDDYSKRETNTVYEGREPKHDNEAAVSNLTAQEMNKKVGDMMTIKIDGMSRNFLIVGITQHMINYGRSVSITEDGYRRYYPDFEIPSVGIYLKNGTDLKQFIKAVNSKYNNSQIAVTDYNSIVDSIIESLKMPIKICVSVFILITAAFVCLILMFLIKVRLLKDRIYLGIYKALGYTTFQLMTQTVLSLMFVIVTGILIGTVFGLLFSNSLMASLLSNMGIHNCSMEVSLLYVICTDIGIALVSYIFTNIASYRIRKVTPCDLYRM